MAVRHGYGKIAGADALVFAYDTGDTRNSYKGEPTVNLASNPDFSNGTTGWNANQNVTLSVETINNIRFLKVKSNQTNSTPGFKSGNITVSGNTTYTLTIRAYKNDSKGIWLYATGNGTGGSDIVWTPAPNGPNPITTELTTISRTFTTPSDMTYLQIGALWANPLTTSEVYVEYMQLEQKSHATQFVNGTRSSTQGLLDLTGNEAVDLTNVSFDSNAQMTFDGTDDGISIMSGSTVFINESFAVETVLQYSAYTSNPTVYFSSGIPYAQNGGLHLRIYPTNGLLRMGFYSDDLNTAAGAVTADKYNHIVMQYNYDTDTSSIYVNGIQKAVGNQGPYSYNALLPWPSIGHWGDPTYSYNQRLNGKMPVFKFYSRDLTPDEIRTNYVHYKGRYQI